MTVRDRSGQASCSNRARSNPDGSIQGNDNDADAARFEPHYTEITRPDQVQIYESIMVGPDGALTTGLLTAVRYVKDNRLLPRGFDKRTAEQDIAVHGDAERTPIFGRRRPGPLFGRLGRCAGTVPDRGRAVVSADLLSLGEESQGLRRAGAKRFIGYYEAMSSGSGVMLVRAAASAK